MAEHIEERFSQIQAGLPALWRRIQNPRSPRFVIAVPSISLDVDGLPLPGGLIHFEERMLYLLHLLGQPACRLWFHSSHLISEEEIAYYLHFLHSVPFSHARNRLRLQPLMDRSTKPLTQKLLERPALLERLRRQIQQCPDAYLTVYRSTELEMRLAVELGVPILGTDPRHRVYASKSNARRIFEELGLRVPAARVDLRNLSDLTEALVSLHKSGEVSVENPRVIIKQNDGISGLGNRTLSLMAFWDMLSSGALEDGEKAARLERSLQRHWEDTEGRAFWSRFQRLGGIVETFQPGESVSVQLQISPVFEVDIVGIHLENLDARGRYMGAIFPAPDRYAAVALKQARQVGEALAARGVAGRVDVDFLVDGDTTYALDINFRKSNSTTSLRTLNLLAGGRYDEHENCYRSASGRKRHVYTSDWLDVGTQASSPQDIIDLATDQSLNYTTASHTGVIFHMLGGASATRRMGVTCVGASEGEAESYYWQSVNVFS